MTTIPPLKTAKEEEATTPTMTIAAPPPPLIPVQATRLYVGSLTRQEFRRLASDTATLANWVTVRDFAVQIYGPKVVAVCLETYSKYNDKGGYDEHIESITAHDAEGNTLSPDYTLPFFQTKVWKHALSLNACDEGEEEGIDLVEVLYDASLSDEEAQAWVHIDELPCDDAIYDLSVIPTLALNIVNIVASKEEVVA